ncbi:hypothetical protein M0P65_01360 [Candidatus Gracilibacteria bacterium]|nr:hypothetical protein [Candidatus Gracilibacteria bacterium]
MFSVVLSEEVIYDIDNFIDSYRKIFLNRFLDTGIFNENLIRKNYIELSKEFRNNIYNEIDTRLKQKRILGNMVIDELKYSIFIIVGNYSILLNYIENIEDKIRFVENINFYKK